MYHIVIEQTNEYENRMKYDPVKNTFYETEYKSLAKKRKVKYPYGWIQELGTPPEKHLDVFLLSKKNYALGDILEINIIGCFRRNDGDHKLIGVLPERLEYNFSQLPINEKEVLIQLYPRINQGEGWLGAKVAKNIINDFKQRQMK